MQVKPSPVFVSLVALSLIGGAQHLPSPESRTPSPGFEFTQVHMGLPVRIVIHARDETAARAAALIAFARIAALDRMMSDHRVDSELRRLERRSGRYVPVSRELFDVLARAVAIAEVTGGAFDPTVGPVVALWREARRTRVLPDRDALADARAGVGWRLVGLDEPRTAIRLAAPGMRLDLGGIAKGYILQEALISLRAAGITRALIESGGDLVAGDPPPRRDGWRIAVPGADPGFAARASRLANAALASSGASAQFVEIDGVRYSHVVDPRSGLGVTSPRLARVIAADGATADALATALTIIDTRSARVVAARMPGVLISIDEGSSR